jgi:tetratricopeptide (TPR) repeat protein
MRCRYFWILALSAIVALWTAALAADDTAPAASKSTDLGTQNKDAVSDALTPAKSPTTGMPTLAKRKQASAVVDTSSAASPAGLVQEPVAKQSQSTKTKMSEEPLRPIPDSLESGPLTIEAASFKGVVPGVSTKQDVVKAWGQPKKTAHRGDALVQQYTVEPFRRIELNYAGDKVASVVIRLDRAFPTDAVARQLDLATVRPVLVYNEMGEVLGLSYPERGVLFAFEANKESSKDSAKPSTKVAQIVLEPITAEPFVLRAESTLETRCDLSRRDLEEALTLESSNARAHWLLSRALATMGQYEKAAAEAGQAVKIEPDNPRYRVTYAQILTQLNRLSEAINEAQKAIDNSQDRPHVKARALCLAGDLTAGGPKPDCKKALALHTQAVQLADSLATDPHPAVRVAAKEVLVDAYLGAAQDIAWGDWKEKEKSVPHWIERAVATADDLVRHEGAGPEQLFHAQVRAMAACVALRGAVDPESQVKAVVSKGDELIGTASDPAQRAQLQADLGLALYDAVQIYQMRSEQDNALKYGQQAAGYLVAANEAKHSPSSALLLGRLYFRLGTIYAIRDRNHKAAVDWFDKAVPLLEQAPPEELAGTLGRHGEAFVSMGVSYWEAGQQKRAVALTEKGIHAMEQAAKKGQLDRAALAVPYANLAAMHRKLGSNDLADRYQELASRAKKASIR